MDSKWHFIGFALSNSKLKFSTKYSDPLLVLFITKDGKNYIKSLKSFIRTHTKGICKEVKLQILISHLAA